MSEATFWPTRMGLGSGGPSRGHDAQHLERRASSQVSMERRLVLIAEDEEPIAEALSLIVEDAGFTPLVATHGKEALDLARMHRPALVLTDLMMPHMSGAQLIEALRMDAQREGVPPPPIVLVTAAGMRFAREAGADAILQKPFDLDEVEHLLQRYLGTPPAS